MVQEPHTVFRLKSHMMYWSTCFLSGMTADTVKPISSVFGEGERRGKSGSRWIRFTCLSYNLSGIISGIILAGFGTGTRWNTIIMITFKPFHGNHEPKCGWKEKAAWIGVCGESGHGKWGFCCHRFFVKLKRGYS